MLLNTCFSNFENSTVFSLYKPTFNLSSNSINLIPFSSIEKTPFFLLIYPIFIEFSIIPVLVAGVPISIPERIALYSSSSFSFASFISSLNGFSKKFDKVSSVTFAGAVVIFSSGLKYIVNYLP